MDFFAAVSVSLLAELEDVKTWTLVLGIGTFAAGVLLMIRHKKHLDEIERTERDERLRNIEYRKFRRRTTVSSLVAAIGVLLGSLYWANEPMVFSALIAVMLVLLVLVLGLAALDLLTVSLHGMADTRDEARKKMVQHYLKLRQEHLRENEEHSDAAQDSAGTDGPATESETDPAELSKVDPSSDAGSTDAMPGDPDPGTNSETRPD